MEDGKQKTKTKTRKLSIRTKILIPSTILIIVVCVILGLNSYRHVYYGMVAMGVEEADMAAAMSLSAVDGDLIGQIRAGSEETQEYQQMLAAMREARDRCGIKYLYTLYEENGTVYYGIDADESQGQNMPGEAFEVSYEELADVFAGGEYVQDYIDSTEDGDLITVYKPVTDSQGQVVGILGSDYDAAGITERLNSTTNSIFEISAVCLVAALVLLFVIMSGIKRNLEAVNYKIYDLVHNEGDLTRTLQVTSGDELELIADNINKLLEYMRAMMLQITDNSVELNNSSRLVAQQLSEAQGNICDVSSSMEEMSAAMEETNASLEQVNDSINEISSITGEITDKAVSESGSAEKIADRARELYTHAQQAQQNAKQRAAEMSTAVQDKIGKSKAVEQINSLTDEIISITKQTSLLSLNASIEAARAGEAGRGFAVVADEIGTLAAHSEEAAKEISRVSGIVIEAVNELALEANDMLQFLEQETMAGYNELLDNSMNYEKDVAHLNQVLQGFAEEIKSLNGSMNHIYESVSVVHTAVDESTGGITNVAEISADLTEGMKNIEEEANGNRDIAEQLHTTVGRFKV